MRVSGLEDGEGPAGQAGLQVIGRADAGYSRADDEDVEMFHGPRSSRLRQVTITRYPEPRRLAGASITGWVRLYTLIAGKIGSSNRQTI